MKTAQDFLKEEESFYKNGQAENVTYKNFDLEIFKTENYSPSGKILSSYNYDPKTGKRDGEFFDFKKTILARKMVDLNFFTC